MRFVFCSFYFLVLFPILRRSLYPSFALPLTMPFDGVQYEIVLLESFYFVDNTLIESAVLHIDMHQ